MNGIKFAGAIALFVCTGCSAVNVAQESSTGACQKTTSCSHDLPGIPYNVKVPQRVQLTKRVAPTVVITATKKIGDKVIHLPMSPVEFYPTKDADVPLLALQAATSEEAAIAALQALSDIATSQTQPTRSGQVVANTVTVEAQLSDRQYYFSPTMPLVGSSNSTVKLSGDGTMTEASVNVTDKTLEVLPNLLPVKEIFSAAIRNKLQTTLPALDISIGRGGMLFTLRREIPKDKVLETYAPLTFEQAANGAEGVQIVSVASTSAPSGAAPDGGKPGYTITGKITLPETKPEK